MVFMFPYADVTGVSPYPASLCLRESSQPHLPAIGLSLGDIRQHSYNNTATISAI